MMSNETDWLTELRSTDAGRQASAVASLRQTLIQGLRVALVSRGDVGEEQLEDFAQEGLIRVLNRLDQFAGRSRFTAWAVAVALNAAFSELRRHRWRDVSLEELLADGDRTLVNKALCRAIREDLTPRQRAAILGELRGLPFDQVAALLGSNRNAAYKLVHDARRALIRGLHEAGITAEDIRYAYPQ